MTSSYHFDEFRIDPDNRRLTRADIPVELNARYFDALLLMVRDAGRLVSKDRFMAEVWRGIPVTDEALTQCIRTLRRQLGDDAAAPRFIETVPKHGYRFVGVLENDGPASLPSSTDETARQRFTRTVATGTAGAAGAGVMGGILYGFIASSQPLEPGTGAASVLIVLLTITTMIAIVGGAAVSLGIAAANMIGDRPWRWSIAGGAAGGLVIGAVGKLLGLDAFSLLLGQSPGDITGAMEGTVLGAAVGLALWLANRGSPTPRRAIVQAALVGAGTGALLSLLGGRLMAGSLALVAERVPNSRLRIDQAGALFGEAGFGPASRTVTSMIEAALFVACITAAMILLQRGQTSRD